MPTARPLVPEVSADTRAWREGRGEEPLSDADFRARWEALQARAEALAREEDALILEAIEASGTKKEAAKKLGIENYTTFTSRVQRIEGRRAKGPSEAT